MFKRIISSVILVNFILSSVIPNSAYAQALDLPTPGTLVGTSEAFTPVILKGLQVKPENPLLFDFIVDTGNTGLKPGTVDDAAIKVELEKLVKYFLASLTLPEKDQWVNLSPYEKDRMMTEELEKTELGRDMLAQDYLLKQVTASLIYPEQELGKQFWQKVYEQAREKFGSSDIPMDTFNKVWVVADKADVYVHDNTAFVVGSHLKVMLESDYVAQNESKVMSAKTGSFGETSPNQRFGGLEADYLAQDEGRKDARTIDEAGADRSSIVPRPSSLDQASDAAKQIIREIVLPALEAEVNTGKNFANLRQIFHSMILATWYKKNLKEALLNQVYSDKAKTNGVELAAAASNLAPQAIYTKYVEAYKKGVFNFIKEDTDTMTGETVPRKYFSGGLMDMAKATVVDSPKGAEVQGDAAMIKVAMADSAMIFGTQTERVVKFSDTSAAASYPASLFLHFLYVYSNHVGTRELAKNEKRGIWTFSPVSSWVVVNQLGGKNSDLYGQLRNMLWDMLSAQKGVLDLHGDRKTLIFPDLNGETFFYNREEMKFEFRDEARARAFIGSFLSWQELYKIQLFPDGITPSVAAVPSASLDVPGFPEGSPLVVADVQSQGTPAIRAIRWKIGSSAYDPEAVKTAFRFLLAGIKDEDVFVPFLRGNKIRLLINDQIFKKQRETWQMAPPPIIYDLNRRFLIKLSARHYGFFVINGSLWLVSNEKRADVSLDERKRRLSGAKKAFKTYLEQELAKIDAAMTIFEETGQVEFGPNEFLPFEKVGPAIQALLGPQGIRINGVFLDQAGREMAPPDNIELQVFEGADSEQRKVARRLIEQGFFKGQVGYVYDGKRVSLREDRSRVWITTDFERKSSFDTQALFRAIADELKTWLRDRAVEMGISVDQAMTVTSRGISFRDSKSLVDSEHVLAVLSAIGFQVEKKSLLRDTTGRPALVLFDYEYPYQKMEGVKSTREIVRGLRGMFAPVTRGDDRQRIMEFAGYTYLLTELEGKEVLLSIDGDAEAAEKALLENALPFLFSSISVAEEQIWRALDPALRTGTDGAMTARQVVTRIARAVADNPPEETFTVTFRGEEIFNGTLEEFSEKDLLGQLSQVDPEGGDSYNYSHRGSTFGIIDAAMASDELLATPGLKMLQENFPYNYDIVVQFLNSRSAWIRKIFEEVNRMTVADMIRELADLQRLPKAQRPLHVYTTVPVEDMFFFPTAGSEDWWQGMTGAYQLDGFTDRFGEEEAQKNIPTSKVRAVYMMFRIFAALGDPSVPLLSHRVLEPGDTLWGYLTSTQLMPGGGVSSENALRLLSNSTLLVELLIGKDPRGTGAPTPEEIRAAWQKPGQEHIKSGIRNYVSLIEKLRAWSPDGIKRPWAAQLEALTPENYWDPDSRARIQRVNDRYAILKDLVTADAAMMTENGYYDLLWKKGPEGLSEAINLMALGTEDKKQLIKALRRYTDTLRDQQDRARDDMFRAALFNGNRDVDTVHTPFIKAAEALLERLGQTAVPGSIDANEPKADAAMGTAVVAEVRVPVSEINAYLRKLRYPFVSPSTSIWLVMAKGFGSRRETSTRDWVLGGRDVQESVIGAVQDFFGGVSGQLEVSVALSDNEITILVGSDAAMSDVEDSKVNRKSDTLRQRAEGEGRDDIVREVERITERLKGDKISARMARIELQRLEGDFAQAPGGIDLNADNMSMNEQGQEIYMQFDPAMVDQFKRGDFTGLTPVILNITPITNIKPLLGLASAIPQDGEISSSLRLDGPEAVGSPAADAQGINEAVRREPELS